MTDLPPLPRLPTLQFAVFDEFGAGADDRVQDYARVYGAACAAQEREACEIKVVAAGMRRVKGLDLREELEHCRADAERYRWLKDQPTWSPELEQAIDAARARETP